jgi:hypothetical protein
MRAQGVGAVFMRVSISREKGILLHTVVPRTIRLLESRKLISVIRKENRHHLIKELKESNIYT